MSEENAARNVEERLLRETLDCVKTRESASINSRRLSSLNSRHCQKDCNKSTNGDGYSYAA